MKVETRKCTGWDNYKTRIIADLYEKGHFRKGRFLFRGQGGESWSLSSSFDRWYKGERPQKLAVAEKLLNQFRTECELEDIPDDVRGNEILMLSLAQHNGLPTRLLDWSESPYVAAFFAFSGHIRHGLNFEKHAAIWVIDSNSHIWNREYGCEIVQVPAFGNERIKNQYGKFTYLRAPYDSIEEYVEQHNEPQALIKYLVPVSDALSVMSDLDSMGLNHARIYPGLSGNAKAAEVRVLVELISGL